jgi:hypothetical protein
MSARIAAALIVVSALSAPAQAAPAPAAASAPRGRLIEKPKEVPAPAGFKWHDHAATRGRYLVPTGWHVQESTHDGVLQLTISEEPAPPESTRIQTSFTAHVFGRPADRKADGSRIVDRWIAQLQGLPGAQVKATPLALGPFKGQQVLAKVPAGGGTPAFRLAGMGLVNGDTGATYVIRFESPESAGEKAAQWAQPLLGQMILETEY